MASPPASSSLSPANNGRILAKVLADRLGYGEDNDPDYCITFISCNGRRFYVQMSPFFICNSPLVESRYRTFISVVRDDYQYDDDDETETRPHPEHILDEFHAWLIGALEPLFLRLAPDIPPSFDPARLATGEIRPLLSEYLFPEQHYCRLEVENEKPFPIHLPDEEEEWATTALHPIHPELAQELRQHVKFFDPSSVEVSFRKPEHALFKEPTRVLVELDDSGQKTPCFFKSFGIGGYFALGNKLENHLRVLKAALSADARVPRLRGVVVAEGGLVAGLLLTYVDARRENDGLLFADRLLYTPIPLRQRWASQIQETVAQLHGAGLLWGDAHDANVVIDKNDDAWLIGLGGGRYTEGWVDKDKAGTKEGDLQGVAKIVGQLRAGGPYEPLPWPDWDSDQDE